MASRALRRERAEPAYRRFTDDGDVRTAARRWGDSWYWHLVAPRLRGRGHEVVAPDLPADDDAAGLRVYADTAMEAIGDRADVIVVAHTRVGQHSEMSLELAR